MSAPGPSSAYQPANSVLAVCQGVVKSLGEALLLTMFSTPDNEPAGMSTPDVLCVLNHDTSFRGGAGLH